MFWASHNDSDPNFTSQQDFFTEVPDLLNPTRMTRGEVIQHWVKSKRSHDLMDEVATF